MYQVLAIELTGQVDESQVASFGRVFNLTSHQVSRSPNWQNKTLTPILLNNLHKIVSEMNFACM